MVLLKSLNLTAINGRYSSSWIIHAASTVVSRPIKSVYPVVNGPVDGYIGILNTTFRPKISKSSNEFVIMCTHSNTATSSSNNCAPNHFVPLIPKEDASKQGGEYCKEVKKSFIPLDPPPEPSSVVVVKMKYSSLVRDLNHKKRVTWFDMSPELPVAVVEYIGSYTTNTNVHDNASSIC